MLKGVTKVPGWLAGRRPVTPPVPFAVTCPCGEVARGIRQARHQTPACARCGRTLFVLPASPLPPVVVPSDRPAVVAATPPVRSAWAVPLAAAGVTLILAVTALAALLYHLRANGPRAGQPPPVVRHLEAGRAALAQGKVATALEEFGAATALAARKPDGLSPAERRRLAQLYRQTALLNDLLPVSIEDVLAHAADLREVDEREWQTVFRDRYHGKAVIFDADVCCEAAGKYRLDYAAFLRGRRATLDVADVRLLVELNRRQLLPTHQPRRLLFGVRLADVGPEAGGAWVVHFQPDSGVLLTEAAAAAAWYPQPVSEIQDVLERQAAWADQLGD